MPAPSSASVHSDAVKAVLVPVKAFRDAKVRLASALPAHDRAALARQMGEQVIAAARDLPVAVVCDDEEVAAWAASLGAHVIWTPARGLDRAVADGVKHLATEGARQVIVAHADLPLADDLTWVADFEGITLVPDRRDDGTNVMCIPAGCGFHFAYGARSFQRHVAEATRLRLPIRIARGTRLSWDVDGPSDLVYS